MRLLFFFYILFLLASCQTEPEESFSHNYGEALGTSYSIQYEGKEDFQPVFDSVFRQINLSMSTYLKRSAISRINKGDTTVVVDSLFRTVFEASKAIHQKTDGMFDPTVGPLVNAYGFGPSGKLKTVDSTKIDSLMAFVGLDKVQITTQNRLEKEHPSLFLDFNAIAKGYTVDLLSEALEKKGIKNYLIELGGELRARGQHPVKKEAWRVGIDNPTVTEGREIYQVIPLRDRAMATSGNYRKFLKDTIRGVMYVHSINPKTGWPEKSNVLSTTVLTENCMLADAYATAFMVMPLEESKKILRADKTLQAYIIFTDANGELQEYFTPGFPEPIKD